MAEPKIRKFTGRVQGSAPGEKNVPLEFDPAAVWGTRDRYHVTGTIDGVGFRGSLVHRGDAWRIVMGAKSQNFWRVQDGQSVAVEIWPEGPQAAELAPDIFDALDERPRARAAFEALATFYRRGWLRWIDATKRRPEVRAERIAEMVELLEAGHKERPPQPGR
jgi:hypothetical protein